MFTRESQEMVHFSLPSRELAMHSGMIVFWSNQSVLSKPYTLLGAKVM